jgi:branched-chain amino acid transport system ATP-binding protein
VVEQNVATAPEFADHAYIVDLGRITASGTAAAIAAELAVRTAYLGL